MSWIDIIYGSCFTNLGNWLKPSWSKLKCNNWFMVLKMNRFKTWLRENVQLWRRVNSLKLKRMKAIRQATKSLYCVTPPECIRYMQLHSSPFLCLTSFHLELSRLWSKRKNAYAPWNIAHKSQYKMNKIILDSH